MSSVLPPAPPQKPAKMPGKAPVTAEKVARKMSVQRGLRDAVHKVIIYGSGGCGKTSLAALLQDIGIDTVFIDIEDGTNFLDVARMDPTPQTFEELLSAIDTCADSDCQAIVIDSLTKAEELAVDYTLRTVPHEKPGNAITSVESYGFGKGLTHVYESFLLLMQAMDAATRKGKHVIGICHECTASVPNPSGLDFIRYEPRLQSPPSGKGSIRHRIKEWADHVLYIGFDVFVEDGKGKGSGTRTIHSQEMPTWWAKSRSLAHPIPYVRGDSSFWNQLFQKGQQ